MTHATDIVAYTYKADIYCPTCIEEIALGEIQIHGGRPPDFAGLFDTTEQLLNRWAARVKICREDEGTFDSGDFPKVVFRDMLEDGHDLIVSPSRMAGSPCCPRCHNALGE